jgi:aspartate/tyrosine/aromatic aminotransferase
MDKFRINLGIDPTKEEWRKICRVIQEKKLLPFFDCAYQGFATGDLVSKLL